MEECFRRGIFDGEKPGALAVLRVRQKSLLQAVRTAFLRMFNDWGYFTAAARLSMSSNFARIFGSASSSKIEPRARHVV